MTAPPGWETVIGLEVHAQLLTRTKIFCGCPTAYGASPNTQVCPVCTGQPGVLPVLNEQAVRLAVRAARALSCRVPERSQFARKNYFYPDLPKGYQISQFDLPLAAGGHLSFPDPAGPGERTARILRLHMEEDAGKSVHPPGRSVSLLDFNRAGTPLAEIVSEPDLRTADEASAYLKELRLLLRTCGVSDGNMEEGSFRCDANISVRRAGAQALGVRVEIKNLNSFKHVRLALEAERARQVAVVEAGGAVEQETRLWDDDRGVTRTMRGKEEAHDYRYFPDPDLPPLRIPEGWEAEPVRTPSQVRAALRAAGLDERQAREIAADEGRTQVFDALSGRHGASVAARWALSGSLPADDPAFGLAVLHLHLEGRINAQAMARVFEARGPGEAAAAVVARLGLEQVSDADLVAGEAARVVAAFPDEAARHRAGDAKVFAFLMGQCMRALRGRGDPRQVRAALLEALDARD